jgi:hypothetical protein
VSEPTETSKPSITFRPTRFGGVDYVPVDCGFDTPERMANLVRHLVIEPAIDAPTAAAMVVWMCRENVGKTGTLETFKAAIVGAWAACGGGR